MDMHTLKSIIIELKDDKGMTFREISEYLNTNYGINKTRQALSGLYNRAKEAMVSGVENQRLTCDIVNLYCLLDSATQVCEELNKVGYNVSYSYILKILKNEEKYIQSVQETIVANIESKLEGLTDIRDVSKIEYKGVRIKGKKFALYFNLAYEHYIKTVVLDKLSTMYQLTGNKGAVREVAQKFNIKIITEDIKR